MKRVTMWLLTVITLGMGLCMLTACGSPEGKYYFDSMEVAQNYFENYQLGDEYLGETLEKDFCVLELKEDGTFTMQIKGDAQKSGTWESRKEKPGDTLGLMGVSPLFSWFSSKIEYVELSLGEDTIRFIRDGDRLKMTGLTYEGMWLVLVK